jgi:hypothetical protein
VSAGLDLRSLAQGLIDPRLPTRPLCLEMIDHVTAQAQ